MRFIMGTLRIEFMDGEIQTHPFIIRGEYRDQGITVEDGVLSCWSQNGELAPHEHVGSWPVCNIRSYQISER